jgi:hypothetical protein
MPNLSLEIACLRLIQVRSGELPFALHLAFHETGRSIVPRSRRTSDSAYPLIQSAASANSGSQEPAFGPTATSISFECGRTNGLPIC